MSERGNTGAEARAVAAATNEPDAPGYTGKGFQIGFNHDIPKAKVDVHAGYLGGELDVPSGIPGVDEISQFVIGPKLKFD